VCVHQTKTGESGGNYCVYAISSTYSELVTRWPVRFGIHPFPIQLYFSIQMIILYHQVSIVSATRRKHHVGELAISYMRLLSCNKGNKNEEKLFVFVSVHETQRLSLFFPFLPPPLRTACVFVDRQKVRFFWFPAWPCIQLTDSPAVQLLRRLFVLLVLNSHQPI